MANEHPDRDELDTLPTDLQALHHQLQADSADWSRHVPSSERLITHYQTLLEQRQLDATPATVSNDIPLHSPLRSERGYMNRTQKRLSGIFAAIMVAVLIAATVVIFQHHPGKTGNSTAATPTLIPTATLAPALHVSASQGWVYPSALAFGKTILFAPNAPLTGYVCGNMSTQADAPLRFSVTHDGGATWRELAATPAQGATCTMSIDPTNADDLVLFSTSYVNGTSTYRSQDGGKTWSSLLAPAGDSVSVHLDESIWAGSTLFVTASADSNTAAIHLAHATAVSVNGGALTWVDTSHLAHLKNPNDLQSLRGGFAIGTTYYAYLSENPPNCYGPYPIINCTTISATIVKTSDNGAMWTSYTFANPANQTYHARTMADGHTLLGSLFPPNGAPTYSISTDVGQAWTALPALPQPSQGESGGGMGPSAQDGTLYAVFYHDSTPYVLLKLSPGATAWATVVDTFPGSPALDNPAVSVDGLGHPNAVWSDIYSGGSQQPGIAYHAP